MVVNSESGSLVLEMGEEFSKEAMASLFTLPNY